MALNAFAAAAPSTRDLPAKRERIEHSQVVDPQDIPRYKALGVIASMQPSHLLTDMNWASPVLVQNGQGTPMRGRPFCDAGVPLAFGTDYPVEPITPFRGIYAGVTRSNETGASSYFPQDRLTLGQALFAYTQGSAYAEFSETFKGKLIPGDVADFVVLDRDLTRIPAPEILKTQCAADGGGRPDRLPGAGPGSQVTSKGHVTKVTTSPATNVWVAHSSPFLA